MVRGVVVLAFMWGVGLAGWLGGNGVVNAYGALPLGTWEVTNQLNRPVFVTSPATDIDRLFVLEQHTGRIEVVDRRTGAINTSPLLTVGGLATGNEQGLLGLAFHPEFATNGLFYTNHTTPGGAFGNGVTRITEWKVNGNPMTNDVVDESSQKTVLTYDQPFRNHNGGWMDFGPDGYLYVSSGDGGSGNDPQNHGQRLDSLLGKVLRLDVNDDDFPADSSRNYAVPADNPFVDAAGRDEIWAYGLRNPWRMSFDRENGDLYIGDVGQGAREEINRQSADSKGGENYGWRLREGLIETPGPVGGAKPPGAVDPILEYPRSGPAPSGRSVTGGYVYRGIHPDLEGRYFFGDFFGGIWSISPEGEEFTDWTSALRSSINGGSVSNMSSFGEDAFGNLYMIDLGDGQLFRVMIPGDADFDGDVDADDLEILEGNLGMTAGADIGDGDFDGDGDVDGFDFGIWQEFFMDKARVRFGGIAGVDGIATSVPEPSVAGMILLVTMGVTRLHKRT